MTEHAEQRGGGDGVPRCGSKACHAKAEVPGHGTQARPHAVEALMAAVADSGRATGFVVA